MKYAPVLFSALLSALMFCSCNQGAKRAAIYRDNFLKPVQQVIDSSLDFGDAIQSNGKQRGIVATDNYQMLIARTISKLQAEGDFRGDTTLRVYSLELLQFYKKSLDTQFKPFLQSVKDEAFSETEAQQADSLFRAFALRENTYWERFNWAEKKFERDHKIIELEK